MKIEALHDFHDKEFSKGWANKFKPTPQRMELFETILRSIQQVEATNFHILELGIGPGFLAEFLLSRLDKVTYEGLDFAKPMLEIAAERLHLFKDRTTFTQADLTNDNWTKKISQPPQVIVSTWALHDLFNAENIQSVYLNSHKALAPYGLFLNGDFIKPKGVEIEYEAGRIEISTHLRFIDR